MNMNNSIGTEFDFSKVAETRKDARLLTIGIGGKWHVFPLTTLLNVECEDEILRLIFVTHVVVITGKGLGALIEALGRGILSSIWQMTEAEVAAAPEGTVTTRSILVEARRPGKSASV